ncbi:MAG: DUF1801 domain-containing protein [Steroidobacteraceae bacterium]
MASGKAKSKTVATAASVHAYIAAVANDVRRSDAQQLLTLLAELTGWRARMWGPSIIGFGTYHYTYDTGREGSICAVGFSPRKTSLVIYAADFPGRQALLAQLGKHKNGKGCLYINKLADIDMPVLRKILQGGLAEVKKTWPVTAT